MFRKVDCIDKNIHTPQTPLPKPSKEILSWTWWIMRKFSLWAWHLHRLSFSLSLPPFKNQDQKEKWVMHPFVSDKSSATISIVHSRLIRQAEDRRKSSWFFCCKFPLLLESPSQLLLRGRQNTNRQYTSHNCTFSMRLSFLTWETRLWCPFPFSSVRLSAMYLPCIWRFPISLVLGL